MQEDYTFLDDNRQIFEPVIVIIACGATRGITRQIKSRLLRDILKPAISQIVVETIGNADVASWAAINVALR